MRALVLGGAGAVCKETTRDLAMTSVFEQIVVADYNELALADLLGELNDDHLSGQFVDANDYDSLVKLFPGFDVVVNGLPFKYDLVVNQACVEVGVNGLDVSSDDAQFAMSEEARRKGMLFVPGVGATPGITNMMVRRAADNLDEIESAEIYFAAFRCLAPAPGLLQTTLWEFDPEEPSRAEVYYGDGEWHPAPPLSGALKIRFHDQIGEQTVYFVPHDESYTLPSSYPTLRHASVRGCFPPHVMEIMSALSRAGLLSRRPVQLNGGSEPALEVVRSLLSGSPLSLENPVWAYGLVVKVEGKREGRSMVMTFRSSHPPQEEWGGEAAYFKNVGLPLSIGAQLIASGACEGRGVLAPEVALPPDRFFSELSRRGIQVEETIVEAGTVSSAVPVSE
jgi:saccharopine dehydrogenase-like NADP-dependent oxidoreductase